MHSIGIGLSDVGRVRDNNEDNLLVDDDLGLYVVSDGMGGHVGGEVASAIAVQTVHQQIRRHRQRLRDMASGSVDREAVENITKKAVEQASRRIDQEARGTDHEGMGCTLTLLLIVGNKAVVAHVGDTRLYLCRNGQVSQLSTDHTMANELAIAGVIAQDSVHWHQYAHVLTRALGSSAALVVDTLVLDIIPGDRFLLCSDGLADHIETDEWLNRQFDLVEFDAIPEELVSYANAAGGHDNVTVVVARIEPDAPEVVISDEMSSLVHGKFDALESVFLFEGLSMALLTRVIENCEVCDFEPGEQAFEQNRPLSRLMVVVEGRFGVYTDGEESGELGPGGHVGATSLLSPRRARGSLEAKSPARLLVLEREAFWKLIRQRPWLGVGLLERLGRRLSQDLERALEQQQARPSTVPPIAPAEQL